MRSICGIITAVLFIAAGTANAASNAELTALMQADQAARQGPIDEAGWKKISADDAQRRQTVLAMLKAGEIETAEDYFNAALIFQHGETADEIRMAHAFATIASALDAEMSSAGWLKAASWDRLMMRFGQPQWYGTQFIKQDGGEWVLHPVLPEVISDEQRQAWSVPTLDAAKQRAAEMNQPR